MTPFTDGEVDLATYRGLVERQLGSGSHGITVNGTSAEPSLLTIEERKAIAACALDVVAGRTQVLVATGGQSLPETVDLTRHATDTGADAVLVVTPYYVQPPAAGLVDYFSAVCGETDLPVLAYHIPGRAAVSMDVGALVAIAERNETFVGMKHASKDLSLVTDVVQELGPDFRVLVGLEELSLPMLAVGACGMVNAVGNLVPDRVAALHEAMAAGDLSTARKLHHELYDLNRAVFFETNPIPLKYMMRRIGILPVNEHRSPMAPPTAETERRCDEVLRSAGLLTG